MIPNRIADKGVHIIAIGWKTKWERNTGKEKTDNVKKATRGMLNKFCMPKWKGAENNYVKRYKTRHINEENSRAAKTDR